MVVFHENLPNPSSLKGGNQTMLLDRLWYAKFFQVVREQFV